MLLRVEIARFTRLGVASSGTALSRRTRSGVAPSGTALSRRTRTKESLSAALL